MANTKISAMTAIAAFADAMNIPIQDGSVAEALQNKSFTISQLKTILGSIDLDNLNADAIANKAGSSYPDFTYGFKNTGLFSNLPIDSSREGGTIQKRVALTDATLTTILTLTRSSGTVSIGANVTVVVTNAEVGGANGSTSVHKFFVTHSTNDAVGFAGNRDVLHNGTVSAAVAGTSTHTFTSSDANSALGSTQLRINITAGGSSPQASFAYVFAEWFGFCSDGIANISVS